MKSYAILGTGALGGFYGARLHLAGREVHFLARSDYEAIRFGGLTVDSGGRRDRLNVPVYRCATDLPRCDVAVIALKATQNAALPDILPPAIKPDGVALVLQNGMGGEDLAASILGPDRILGGLCFLCANRVAPGHVAHLDYGEITMGEYRPDGSAGGLTPRLHEIAEDFRAGGISIKEIENLAAGRWRKLVWNVPYNGLSVAFETTTDRIMAAPAMRALAEELMREVAALSAARGYAIEEAFIRKMLDDTMRMKPYRTSMMIDHAEGRPMEIEAIYGEPLRAVEQSTELAPRMWLLYRALRALEAGRG
jgi:2-dehydropantoate 2-reductase